MGCACRVVAGLLLLCGAPAMARAQLPQSAPAQNPSTPAQNPVTQTTPGEPVDPCLATLDQPDSGACYLGAYKVADQDMNHIYRAALVVLEKDLDEAHAKSDSGHAAFDTTAIVNLKDAQAAWVKYRDLQCSAAGQQFEGGTVEPVIIARCMATTTRHRIEEIEDTYEIGGRKLE
jgi:uncharacterized protein YecT (DUF1311 family)